MLEKFSVKDETTDYGYIKKEDGKLQNENRKRKLIRRSVSSEVSLSNEIVHLFDDKLVEKNSKTRTLYISTYPKLAEFAIETQKLFSIMQKMDLDISKKIEINISSDTLGNTKKAKK